jgi:hypothetical protein
MLHGLHGISGEAPWTPRSPRRGSMDSMFSGLHVLDEKSENSHIGLTTCSENGSCEKKRIIITGTQSLI